MCFQVVHKQIKGKGEKMVVLHPSFYTQEKKKKKLVSLLF